MSEESLIILIKKYAVYIVPTWVYPIYFVFLSEIFSNYKTNNHLLSLLLSACTWVPFFITQIWARRVRNHIPYFKFCFLTMFVPVITILSIGIVGMAYQFLTKNECTP